VKISYTTKSNFECNTNSAHMALMEWFINLYPDRDEYYFSANQDHFLVQITAGIEREFNRTPFVFFNLSHEEKCRRYLLWLHENGDIVNLRFHYNSQEA